MSCSTETTSLASVTAVSNQYKCAKHCVYSLDFADSSTMPLILSDYLGKHLFTWQYAKALTSTCKVMGKEKIGGECRSFSFLNLFFMQDIFYARQKTGFPSWKTFFSLYF